MKDIVHDAILFDMYYFMKPPKPNEKVVVPSVTEATPQFRNFYINNIVCNGAERGIFIRGLPEMSIKDIHLNDVVLKTNKGAEIIEVNNIDLNNIQLNCKITKPLIYVANGSNLTFNNISFSHAEQLFSINGEQSSNIKIVHTHTSSVKNMVEFNNGASAGIFNIK
jgi:hypothetical protein